VLEQLFQLVVAFIECFYFATVIRSYERGVILRRGELYKTLDKPGIYFYWPFGFEAMLSAIVTPEPLHPPIGAQSLTTKDGKARTVSSAVVTRIDNIEKALLECDDRVNLVRTTIAGVIAKHIAEHDADEVTHERTWREIEIECRRKCKPYGVYVESVQYSDNAACKSLRLWSAPAS
jgi:regulator of protease activity HflC (stomatin/prohibitin superfamily)